MTQQKKKLLLIDLSEPDGALAFNKLYTAGFSITTAFYANIIDMLRATELITYDLIVVAYDHGINSNGHNAMAELRRLVRDSLPNGLNIVCYSTEKQLDKDDLDSIGDNADISAHLPTSDFNHLVEVVKNYLEALDEQKSHQDE